MAFLCTESEILDRAALAAYIPPVRDVLVAAGGRTAILSSIGGGIAQAWLKSPELAALELQRAKAYRVIRQYIVEAP